MKTYILISLAALSFCSATRSGGQTYPYIFTTLAGESGYGYVDGPVSDARFLKPQGLAIDGAGNLYVSEGDEAGGNETIRKITPGGVVSTVAGKALYIGHVDGMGTNAQFWWPNSIAADGQGTVYVADTRNELIRQIASDGTVRTIAGRFDTSGTTDGLGTSALFDNPTGISRDANGNLYVVDLTSSRIRKLSPVGTNWMVTTLAGAYPGRADGTGTAALFYFPTGLAVDSAGNIFVTDTSNCAIRKVTPGGVVTTFAGNMGYPGSVNGTGTAARFNGPTAIAVDNQDNLYVADGTTVRKITPTAVVTTLAGWAGSGYTNGVGTNAIFGSINALAADSAGNVFVADKFNNVVRKITPAGVVSTWAGPPPSASYQDGAGRSARVSPFDILLGRDGNFYFSDGSHTIRKMSPDGVVSTLAGKGATPGSADGTGANARFSSPSGMTMDSAGNIFVADLGNSTIRKVTPAGAVTTMAGLAGSRGSTDGATNVARFNQPQGVAVDTTGNIYVADTANYTIRKIAAGVVTTIAGLAGNWATVDGTNNTAAFKEPCRILIDNAGNLLVGDSYGAYRVRKISPQGTNWVVTTFAGRSTGTSDGYADMNRYPRASFEGFSGMALDSQGSLYLADPVANLLRKVSNEGTNSWVYTLGGIGDFRGSMDGPIGLFCQPGGVAVDSAGNLFIADTGNHTIRKGTLIVSRPNMQISLAPGSLVLSWPLSPTGYIAEVCQSLGMPWQALSNATVSGTNWVSTNLPTGPSGFYRLRQQ